MIYGLALSYRGLTAPLSVILLHYIRVNKHVMLVTETPTTVLENQQIGKYKTHLFLYAIHSSSRIH